LWPPLTHMFQDRHKVMPQFVSQVGEHNSNNYIWFMVDISILTMVICNMLGIFVVRGFYCFIPGTRFFRTEHVLNALA
jgi:Na+/alanine symporter